MRSRDFQRKVVRREKDYEVEISREKCSEVEISREKLSR